MTEVTQTDIARWRKFKGAGMISAVGEYTPQAFWDVLDALETEREATRPLVEALIQLHDRLVLVAEYSPETTVEQFYKDNRPLLDDSFTILMAASQHTGAQ